MKLLITLALLSSSQIFAEEQTSVVSIREPIPFNLKYVAEDEQKVSKRKVRLPIDRAATIKFKMNEVKAQAFNPRVPFDQMKIKIKTSSSEPLVPKVLP